MYTVLEVFLLQTKQANHNAQIDSLQQVKLVTHNLFYMFPMSTCFADKYVHIWTFVCLVKPNQSDRFTV